MSRLDDLMKNKEGLVPNPEPSQKLSAAVPSASPTAAATAAADKSKHGPTIEQQHNPAMKPMDAADLKPATQPARTSDDQVLFHSFQPNMGYFFKEVRRSFDQGYLIVDDPEEIKMLKENFCKFPGVATPRMEILEEGSLSNPKEDRLKEASGHPRPSGGQFGQSGL